MTISPERLARVRDADKTDPWGNWILSIYDEQTGKLLYEARSREEMIRGLPAEIAPPTRETAWLLRWRQDKPEA